MCFSAQIRADHKLFQRMFGADVSTREFMKLFYDRKEGEAIKIPKAVEAAFMQPQTEEERRIKEMIDAFHRDQSPKFEQELFIQRKRLADAQRVLQSKTTKAALEHQRIATAKIEQLKGWLDDMHRTELLGRDARIYPGWYAPVMVVQDGRKVVLPMRYHCRPQGMPPSWDRQYPGTYNARRDNLEGAGWKRQFGYTHGLMIVTKFYENVRRQRVDRPLAPGEEPENVVVEFTPDWTQDMLVACLWSRWTAPGRPDLLSFAAITDEPPSEVAAAGHDRCIVPLRMENVDAWLNPDPGNLAVQYAILDDRERPYYEHRLAA